MKKQLLTTNWTCNGKAITLPHDAMIHENRRADAPSGSAGAFFESGAYTYERTLTVTKEMLAGHVELQFEGVYKNAKVYINDVEAGGVPYGYLPFFVNCDGLLKEGENALRVECECKEEPDSRWYSGAGIYRPVWLWSGKEEYLLPEGVRVTTLGTDPAKIRVDVAAKSRAASKALISIIKDGAEVAKTEVELTSNDGAQVAVGSVGLTIPDAKLWSAETPTLYECVVTLLSGEEAVDETTETFGIRMLSWNPKGFFVNGKETLLRGGCVHHDSGILGSATYDESEWRRVKLLKDAGFNAIRSAHNPVSRAMLEACDTLGVYMMDEAWDMWFSHKSPYDYAGVWRERYLADLTAMVSRDYNHPCVIMYSIGNEVSEPAKDEGMEKAWEMVEHLHKEDPTRAVSGGINLMIVYSSSKGKGVYKEEGGKRDEDSSKKMDGMSSTMFNMIASMIGPGMNKAANGSAADKVTTPILDALDMAGYNYASGRYLKEGKLHPDRVIFGSETFPQDIAKNWEMVEKYPYLVGDFMWTAWDYLGETGIGAWNYEADGKGFDKPYPWLLADVGAFDILGNPNGELFLAQAAWKTLEHPRIAVQPCNHGKAKIAKAVWRGTNSIPSWSFMGSDGTKATVEVYTEGARAELLLNGVPVGKKKVSGGKAVFSVKYAPGILTAVCYDAAGREIGRDTLCSAEGPIAPAVHPEKTEAAVGEIVYIPVVMEGRNGVVESAKDQKLTVTVENAELLAFGSANPRTEDRFDAIETKTAENGTVTMTGTYSTWYGRALAIVRATGTGVIKVTATDKIREGSAEIQVK